MKKYSILYLLAGLTMFTSCYKMDTVPYDQVSAGSFWKTEDHALQGIMGCYADMKDNNLFGLYFLYDDLSDIAMGYDIGFGDVIGGAVTARTGTFVNRWRRGFDGVQRTNHAIQNIAKMIIPDESRKVFIGEAKFLRALYYFNLMNLFGGVPIYDETVDLNKDFNNLKNPRATEDEVRAFILSDLETAINNLPVSYDAKYAGRATKGAAYALRGKVYLYHKEWNKAIQDFEEIVYNKSNNYGYNLYGDYADLFTLVGDNSSEMIFAIQNKGGTGFPYGMPLDFYLGTRSSFGSCWNKGIPSTRLADMYENLDGTSFNWDDEIAGYTTDNAVKKSAMMATLVNGQLKTIPDTARLGNIYRNRDPRMMQTLVVPYSWYLGWNANKPRPMQLVLATGVNENFGQIRNNRGWLTYVWRKFVPEGNLDGALSDRANTPFNFPLIRLGDVLLMLSEAYNETDQLEKAIVELNKVRDRSHMPGLNSGPAWLAVSSKTGMFDRIFHERAIELAGEGHRYFDLKRWGLLEQVTGGGVIEKSIVGDNLLTRGFQSRHILWPIPAQEIEVNPALTQNPGWD